MKVGTTPSHNLCVCLLLNSLTALHHKAKFLVIHSEAQIPIAGRPLARLAIQDEVYAVTEPELKDHNLVLLRVGELVSTEPVKSMQLS